MLSASKTRTMLKHCLEASDQLPNWVLDLGNNYITRPRVIFSIRNVAPEIQAWKNVGPSFLCRSDLPKFDRLHLKKIFRFWPRLADPRSLSASCSRPSWTWPATRCPTWGSTSPSAWPSSGRSWTPRARLLRWSRASTNSPTTPISTSDISRPRLPQVLDSFRTAARSWPIENLMPYNTKAICYLLFKELGLRSCMYVCFRL